MSILEETQQAERYRTTVYLEEEDLASLDELKGHYRRVNRRKLDRSEIIRIAIRALHSGLLGARGEGVE